MQLRVSLRHSAPTSSFPRRRESRVCGHLGSWLDYSLRSPFGPTFRCSVRFAPPTYILWLAVVVMNHMRFRPRS